MMIIAVLKKYIIINITHVEDNGRYPSCNKSDNVKREPNVRGIQVNVMLCKWGSRKKKKLKILSGDGEMFLCCR